MLAENGDFGGHFLRKQGLRDVKSCFERRGGHRASCIGFGRAVHIVITYIMIWGHDMSANIQVRVDSALKAEAEQLFTDMGLDLPTAVRLFLKQSVIHNGLPFVVGRDPFYSARNQQALRNSIAQMERGEIVRKTMAELEDMAR